MAQGLFSATPERNFVEEEKQRLRNQREMDLLGQLSALTPNQRIGYAYGKAGQAVGNLAKGLFGFEDKSIAEARNLQEKQNKINKIRQSVETFASENNIGRGTFDYYNLAQKMFIDNDMPEQATRVSNFMDSNLGAITNNTNLFNKNRKEIEKNKNLKKYYDKANLTRKIAFVPEFNNLGLADVEKIKTKTNISVDTNIQNIESEITRLENMTRGEQSSEVLARIRDLNEQLEDQQEKKKTTSLIDFDFDGFAQNGLKIQNKNMDEILPKIKFEELNAFEKMDFVLQEAVANQDFENAIFISNLKNSIFDKKTDWQKINGGFIDLISGQKITLDAGQDWKPVAGLPSHLYDTNSGQYATINEQGEITNVSSEDVKTAINNKTRSTEFAKVTAKEIINKGEKLAEVAQTSTNLATSVSFIVDLLKDVTDESQITRSIKIQIAKIFPNLEPSWKNLNTLNQVIDGQVSKLATQIRTKGSGSTSDMEFKAYRSAIPSIYTNKNARELVLAFYSAQANYQRLYEEKFKQIAEKTQKIPSVKEVNDALIIEHNYQVDGLGNIMLLDMAKFNEISAITNPGGAEVVDE